MPIRSLDLRGTLACGRDVRIDVALFEGAVALGDNVSVGAHCVLKDVSVGAGTLIAPFSHLDGATIGADCRIGPYARLRPGAALAADVHIGNFVEVKASTLGRGSKANHLAYVGDARWAAASTSRRHDHRQLRRRNKHRTEIGDGSASARTACWLPGQVGKARPSAPAASSRRTRRRMR